jgi:hypothetical protein
MSYYAVVDGLLVFSLVAGKHAAIPCGSGCDLMIF